jgi:plastocyanin
MKSLHHLFRKRLFWIVLSLAIVTMLTMAACGGSSTTQSGSTAATTAPTQASAATPTDTPTIAAAQSTSATVQVKIVEVNNKYSFEPATITVPKGAKIVWTNTSDAPHTVTSDTSAFTASSTLSQNQTFSMMATTAGTFAYHCSVHTYMKATIVVTA